MTEKDILKQKFSADPSRYYRVNLFTRKGFERSKCVKCGGYFWSLDPNRKTCPNQPCQFYEFLGDPPTSNRFDYLQTWEQIEDFFVNRGHTSIKRYPVVCRWRPDLFFTVASIVDFQRIEGGKVVFELPSNPLIVPQICLRFNDISNVGLSGKHFTSFCMVGQHSIADSEGYWKDRCIDLDYELLTGPFGIKPEEIVFVEDVWLGYGAFGYSLEYYVRGLELGNAVFTAFEGNPGSYTEMKNKVVDMGAGLERFTWITQGTPTSYDCVFGPVIDKMISTCGIEYDHEFFTRYAKIAGALNFDEATDIEKVKGKIASSLGVSRKTLVMKTAPLEALYALTDHTKSLVFAIGDGSLPSNVGGGYNLRVILRRALDLAYQFRWDVKLKDIAGWHIDYLGRIYPELEEHRDEIATILEVEEERYQSTKRRVGRTIHNLSRERRPLTEESLIQLYESEGITPEFLKSQGITVDIPTDFYGKVASRHLVNKKEGEPVRIDIEGIPKTQLLFYKDQNLREFNAKIIKIINGKYVVLDQTAFYPRSGGQEPDCGLIDDNRLTNVEKYGDVVLHELEKNGLSEGQIVRCKVDWHRRETLKRHHTATHIVNGAARRVLGSWVWQHSAFKGMEGARLDITHYAHLSHQDLVKIEDAANQVVLSNCQMTKEVLRRNDAELKYGFRIYQGGVVPGKEVRIISIPDWDVEACGGIHCDSTGEVGLIKILKSERVQDGVERIEFVAGEPAIRHVQNQEAAAIEIAQTLSAQRGKLVEAVNNLKSEYDVLKRMKKVLIRKAAQLESKTILESTVKVRGLSVFLATEEDLDEEYHIGVGEEAVKANPDLVYCAFITRSSLVKILVFSGSRAGVRGVKAGELAKRLSQIVGGSGGGDARFGQGGGNSLEKIAGAREVIPSLIDQMVIE